MNARRSFSALLLALFLTASRGAFAITIFDDPSVTESYNAIELRVEYTVENPPSGFADIVGLVIEAPEMSWTDTANGWYHYALDPGTDWNNPMYGYPSDYSGPGREFPMTWAQFFDMPAYPYPDRPAAAFFLAYTEGEGGLYTFDQPALAVEPGEILDAFYAYENQPASDYILSQVDDASATFDESSMTSVTGTAVPEPTTTALLLVGVFGAVFRRRG